MRERLIGWGLWLAEASAIASLAAGLWWRLDPLAGIALGAGYAILTVNRWR
jgi:hypothetical protein